MRKTILFVTVVALTLVMLAPPASALGQVLTGGVGSCGDEFGNPGDTYGYTVYYTPNSKMLLGFDVYNECVTYLRLSFSSPDQHVTVVVLDRSSGSVGPHELQVAGLFPFHDLTNVEIKFPRIDVCPDADFVIGPDGVLMPANCL